LDARFNKDALLNRIAKIQELRERIRIENMDAIAFLDKFLLQLGDRNRGFVI